MYDLIGDIHGYATPLRNLLQKLGYRELAGIWRHPEQRRVVFLGDFVDRGPEQIETVRIARRMVEEGQALAVMGNHEFNAVVWATRGPDGKPLREHSDKNLRQHAEFLHQVGEGSALHQEMLTWFRTLPLYLDLPGFRVIHACWHPHYLRVIDDYTDAENRVREDAWQELGKEGTDAFEALETLLKGLEVRLPDGIQFKDKQGTVRRNVRIKWWKLHGITYRDLADLSPDVIESIQHDPVPDNILPGYDAHKPLFVGHYWRTGEPAPLNPHIACLDYSIAAKGPDVREPGKLCAYRWDGESELSRSKFVWVH